MGPDQRTHSAKWWTMNPDSKITAPFVQVVGPTDGWVLERLARRLAAKLPYAEFVPWSPQRRSAPGLAYYVNYALCREPSGLIDVGFFTHPEDERTFLEHARRMDFCVCMARQYADWLRALALTKVAHIPMGFDYYRYRPCLVLCVVGLLEHPRKGGQLVEELRRLPFVEIVTTEGRLRSENLRAVYQQADYVLIPAIVEGGPLCLLEALAMGKPVIAPAEVGIVPEFGAAPCICRYPAGNAAALVRLVTDCYEKKRQSARLVCCRTFDDWAAAHHKLFMDLLWERGIRVEEPAPGFRFGMIGELDLPARTNTACLEDALDRIARLLYFGDYGPARTEMGRLIEQFPQARPLLDTIPR
jgi:glycosyltransferase involved in cell wall biosynthesis